MVCSGEYILLIFSLFVDVINQFSVRNEKIVIIDDDDLFWGGKATFSQSHKAYLVSLFVS